MNATVLPERAENPGLAPFDITGYQGLRGTNFYENDHILKRILAEHNRDTTVDHQKAMDDHLRHFGGLCGGILNDLAEASHKEGKYGEIVKYNRTGQRIDEIRYCEEQKQIRRICYEAGLVSLDFQKSWKFPFAMQHRMAMAYLSNHNGEAGVNCPLAMTDGLIRALQAIGTEEQKSRYLPMLAGEGSTSHFMAGQYVTERVGGSNVGANRTVAVRGEDGRWILNGEKWFCSNPGDLWVTTARIDGTSTIGMFLVPRIKRDGTLNGCHLIRKKDIIGSKGKVTAEAVYQDLEAEELGRPAHGLANLIRHIIKTSRVHVSVSAVGMARRAFLEARAYTSKREAYGRRVDAFPVVLRTLAEMQMLNAGLTLVSFRNCLWSESGSPVEQLLTPLLKTISTQHATWISREAILLHGGNGILGDFSPLPRLLNDSIINETWEGTHHIVAEHTMKAMGRPKVERAFNELLDSNSAGAARFDALAYPVSILASVRRRFGEMAGDSELAGMNQLVICDLVYGAAALSELLREAVKDQGRGAFADMASGYAEILERGKLGPVRRGSVFGEGDKMRAVVAL